MEKGKKRKDEFLAGYKAAEEDFLDEEKLKLFKEGYKTGYRDGYNDAAHDLKRMMFLKVPKEVREQMENAQSGWPPSIW